MDDATREFFHQVLTQVAPPLLKNGRDKLINELLIDLFDHPWADEELQRSIINNIARQRDLDVPEKWQEGDEDDGEYLYDTREECLTFGSHLTVCDDDGFCVFCGEQ